MKQAFTIGAFAIIRDELDRVLLVLRNDHDFWNLPGGAVEKGESPWQTVLREVKEETGYDVEVLNLLGIYVKPDKNDLVFSFECKIVSGQITLNEEAKDIRYFSVDEIPQNILAKHLERITDFFSNDKKPIMKIQEGPSSFDLLKKVNV